MIREIKIVEDRFVVTKETSFVWWFEFENFLNEVNEFKRNWGFGKVKINIEICYEDGYDDFPVLLLVGSRVATEEEKERWT